jgi:hypothetical protein
MGTTLDMIAQLHKLILGIALALCVIGLSIHRPTSTYDHAEKEINSLQKGIAAVTDQVNDIFQRIYGHSELKSAALAWLNRRGVSQKDLRIVIVPSGDLQIPDAKVDPLVTLDSQVKWANRVFRDGNNPFYLCSVQGAQVSSALDKLFGSAPPPKFKQLIVFLRRTDPEVNATVHCTLQLDYSVQVGALSGTRSVVLDVPAIAIAVDEVAPPGPDWRDMELANTLKDHDLGDNEDSQSIVLPVVERFWADIGNRPPGAALAWLQNLEQEDLEKSKEKIDILGESLSGSLTIIFGCLIELCFMVYLAVLVHNVALRLPGHSAEVAESQFFGIMSSTPASAVIYITLLFPLAVAAYTLFRVFPAFAAEWPGAAWQVGGHSRSFLLALFAAVDFALIWEVYGIVRAIHREPSSPDNTLSQLQPAKSEGRVAPGEQSLLQAQRADRDVIE